MGSAWELGTKEQRRHTLGYVILNYCQKDAFFVVNVKLISVFL